MESSKIHIIPAFLKLRPKAVSAINFVSDTHLPIGRLNSNANTITRELFMVKKYPTLKSAVSGSTRPNMVPINPRPSDTVSARNIVHPMINASVV